MIKQLDIPEYNSNDGFNHHWENGFEILASANASGVNISANREGLISLAIQLTLAQERVCPWHSFSFRPTQLTK